MWCNVGDKDANAIVRNIIVEMTSTRRESVSWSTQLFYDSMMRLRQKRRTCECTVSNFSQVVQYAIRSRICVDLDK